MHPPVIPVAGAGVYSAEPSTSPSARPRPSTMSVARIARFPSGWTDSSSRQSCPQATSTFALSATMTCPGRAVGYAPSITRVEMKLQRSTAKAVVKAPRPGVHRSHVIMNASCVLAPVDTSMALVEHGSVGREGVLLRSQHAAPFHIRGQPALDCVGANLRQTPPEFAGRLFGADGGLDAREGGSCIHAFVELHQRDAGDAFASLDGPHNGRCAAVLGKQRCVDVHATKTGRIQHVGGQDPPVRDDERDVHALRPGPRTEFAGPEFGRLHERQARLDCAGS